MDPGPVNETGHGVAHPFPFPEGAVLLHSRIARRRPLGKPVSRHPRRIDKARKGLAIYALVVIALSAASFPSRNGFSCSWFGS